MLERLLLLSLLLTSPALALEPYLVKDINPVPEPGDSIPASFVTFGGVALFAAEDGLSGRELWRSDGTAAGTWQVADLCPLEGCSGDPEASWSRTACSSSRPTRTSATAAPSGSPTATPP